MGRYTYAAAKTAAAAAAAATPAAERTAALNNYKTLNLSAWPSGAAAEILKTQQ